MSGDEDPPGSDDLSRRNVRLGAVVVAVLVGMVGFGLVRGARSDRSPPLTGALRTSLQQGGCTVDSRSDPGRAHTSAATYSVNPPAGGDHDPTASPAGFYDVGDVPADGHLVHALEHGFVVVWYKPEAVAAATVDGLRNLVRRHRWVLVAPRPSMPTALAATAWHRRLLCPDGADGSISTFVAAFRNRGPEKGFV